MSQCFAQKLQRDTIFTKTGSIQSISTLHKKGKWLSYNATGQVIAEGNYKKNLKQGIWKQFYPETGSIKSTATYKDDQLEGEYLIYYSNGKLQLRDSFSKNLHHGWSYYYHPNETLAIKGKYQNGKRIGEWASYYENGKLRRFDNFKDGVLYGKSIGYFKNGITEWEVSYRYGKKDGPYHLFYENKNVKEAALFKVGVVIGVWKSFYDNGQVKETRAYQGFMSLGNYWSSKYDVKGILVENGQYRNNLLDGAGELFHPNGIIRAKGSYSNGRKTGPWKYYDLRGQLVETKNKH